MGQEANGTPKDSLSSPDQRKVLANGRPSSLEGLNARRKPRDGKPSVVKPNKKAGRKRRGRSMGPYPFMTHVNKHLRQKGPSYAEATSKELRRRYRRMEKDLKALVKEGEVTTTNPEKMTAEDILAYVNFLKSIGLKGKGISNNLGALTALLNCAKNPAFLSFKEEYRFAIPKYTRGLFPSMDETLFQKIIQTAKMVEESDWKRLRSFALVALALGTGMRNKELRLCQRDDVFINEGIIRAMHVKGEGSYGEPRNIAIRPEIIDILKKYLVAWDRKVPIAKPGCLALFPALRGDGNEFLSTNSIIKMKRDVEKEMGSKFDLRMCRRTYGQKAIDENVGVESVSRLLGHRTTKTTETFYCRKRPEKAIEDAQKVWNAQKAYPDVKTPQIETRRWDTGYIW